METGLNETGFFRGQGNAECWTGVRPNSTNPLTNQTIRNSGGWPYNVEVLQRGADCAHGAGLT